MPVYDKDPPGTGSGSGGGAETDPIASAALVTYISNDNALLVNGTSILGQGLATSQSLTALRATVYGQAAPFANDDSTVVGYGGTVSAAESTVVGSGAFLGPSAVGGTVVGKGSQARGLNDVTIGYGAGTPNTGSYKIAIGTNASPVGADSVSIGRDTASSALSVVLGAGSNAGGTSVTIGASSTGTANDSVRVGYLSNGGTGGKCVAIGYNASYGNQTTATAVGQLSNANGTASSAYGSQANSAGTNSVAVGQLALATSTATTAVGSQANASGTNATCIGSLSVAAGTNTFAMGTQANASFARAVCLGPFATATAVDDVVIGNSATGSNPLGYIRGNQGAGTVHFSPQTAGNITLGVSRVAFYWGNAYVDRLVSRKPINDYIGHKGSTTLAATGVGYFRWTGMTPVVELASGQGTLLFTNTTGWAVRNTSGENQICNVWLNLDFTGIGAGQAGLLVDVNANEAAALATDAARVDVSTAAAAVHSFSCWVFVPDQSYIRAWYHTTSSGAANGLSLARMYVRQI